DFSYLRKQLKAICEYLELVVDWERVVGVPDAGNMAPEIDERNKKGVVKDAIALLVASA
ncbi:hypothetical protein H0H92_000403, partial [Tricholoma furcatifolium]